MLKHSLHAFIKTSSLYMYVHKNVCIYLQTLYITYTYTHICMYKNTRVLYLQNQLVAPDTQLDHWAFSNPKLSLGSATCGPLLFVGPSLCAISRLVPRLLVLCLFSVFKEKLNHRSTSKINQHLTGMQMCKTLPLIAMNNSNIYPSYLNIH